MARNQLVLTQGNTETITEKPDTILIVCYKLTAT